MKIQVLGSGCLTCQTLYKKVLEITKEIDTSLDVEYITDISKIVELGLMSSPVLVVGGDVVSAGGNILSENEIKNSILERFNQ